MKQHPFLSRPGWIIVLIFIAGFAVITTTAGGVLFSPGALSAQGRERPPLNNYTSHADFEGECQWCHVPWQGVTAALCEDCHASVAAERKSSTGLHGLLAEAGRCQQCHIEHQGRAANLTLAVLTSFPHERTGYSLFAHQRWPDGRGFVCRDCHAARAPGYAFDLTACETCHRNVDAAFVTMHAAQYSADCLACHQQVTPFDHQRFPLQAGHFGIRCAACHQSGDFSVISTTCTTCHAEPPIHAGLFGDDCAACHTIAGWQPAQLPEHVFPLDHGGEGIIPCRTCHIESFTAYTCTQCHEHRPDETIKHHAEKGIFDLTDCVSCHAGGRKAEDDEDEEHEVEHEGTE
jgi:hypothetical protein